MAILGSTTATSMTVLNNITASKFIKSGSSDSYVLLGAGGHKLESALNVSSATYDSLGHTIASYFLPCNTAATNTSYGSIKIGYGESGENFAVKLDSNGKAYVTVSGTSFDNYLPLSAGSDKPLTGTLYAQSIYPNSTSGDFNLGTSTYYWASVYANGFYKRNSSDSYVLLGAGGHKAVSDFVQLTGAQTISGNKTFTGQAHFNTATNAAPVIISRNGSTGEAMTIGVDDNQVTFNYTLNETVANYKFIGTWTDTESGGGASAGSKYILFTLSSSAAAISINGNTVLHTGNYTSYTVPKTRYLWGNLFDGSANITGTIAGTKLYLNGTPSEYSSSKTYALNTYVTYSGKVYKCTTAITTAEAWTSSHWTEVSYYLYNGADTYNVGTTSLGHVYLREGSSIGFRDGNSSYYTLLRYDTTGNEALILGMKLSVTSFIVKSGDSGTTATTTSGYTSSGFVPSFQVKGQCVYINELIANGVTPSYNLKVKGTVAIGTESTASAAGTGSLVIFNRGAANTGTLGSATTIRTSTGTSPYTLTLPAITNTVVVAGTPTANYILAANSTTAGDGKWILAVPIANGGTGATTAANARSNLGTWSLVSDSYNTLMPADGTTNGWVKIGTSNSSYGLLPSASGSAGSGHNYIGTSAWYWKYAYVDQIYGSYLNINGTNTSYNLYVNGTTNITGATTLSSTLSVSGNATLSGTTTADSLTAGNLTVTGTSTLTGSVSAGSLSVGGTITASGGTITGNLTTYNIIPAQLNTYSLATTSGNQFNAAYVKTYYENGTALSAKYLALAGGTVTGDILPNTTNCDLGSASKHWGEVHANNICVAGHDATTPICGIKGSDGITYVYCGASTKIVSYDSNTTLKDLYAANYHASTAFYQDSDVRLKNVHNELDLTKAYRFIDKCKSISFDFKNDENHKDQIGVIALEIKEFYPEIVSEDNDYLSVDYSKLSVILMSLVKDLTKRIEKLEK